MATISDLVATHYVGFAAGVAAVLLLLFLIGLIRPAILDMLGEVLANPLVIILIVTALFGFALAGAALAGKINALLAAIAILFGGAAIIVVRAAAERFTAGDRIELQSHWGGLGGGLGGWRLSPGASLALLAFILLAVAVGALTGWPRDKGGSAPPSTSASDKEKSKSDPPAGKQPASPPSDGKQKEQGAPPAGALDQKPSTPTDPKQQQTSPPADAADQKK